MKAARLACLLWLLLLSSLLLGQTNGPSVPATVTFTLDFPHSVPDHYSIVIDSSGKADYTSGTAATKPAPDSDSEAAADSDQPYRYGFTVSPSTREKIFNLAARANYFSGNINTSARNMASTGEKTLAYRDGERATQAKYNYSANVTIQQLTALFQSLSATLEYGRHLDESYHFQKLALDDTLKNMEQQANQNELLEIQALAPILKKIAADPSVINVTRARAERLLAKAGTPVSAH